MKTTKPQLWTKDFIVISLASFLIGFIFLLIMTTISVYVIEEFRASESTAGIAASIFVIGLLFARLFTGKYLEIIGRKKLFYVGVLFSFFATLLYFLVENLSILIFVRLVHGIAVGIALTVMQTAILNIIPLERRGEGISYYSLSFIVSTAIGPFIGVSVIQFANMNSIFIICAIASGATVILSLFASIPKVNMTKEQLMEMKGWHVSDFFESSALPISFIMGIFAFSYSSILSFLASYSKDIHLITAASYFFIVYSIFIFISRPFTGRVLDNKGDPIVIYPSIVFFSLGLFMISQAEHGLTLLIAGALCGLGYGNLLSASQFIAIKGTPKHRMGLATSTFFIFVEGGIGTGPFLLGFLIPIIGFRNMYFALGVVVLLCVLLYYFLHGKSKENHKQISQTSNNRSV